MDVALMAGGVAVASGGCIAVVSGFSWFGIALGFIGAGAFFTGIVVNHFKHTK